MSRSQLLNAGLTDSGITRWERAGRIHRIHRGVYSLGHRAVRIEGRLAAALFHAGRGAVLSHATAAWWWGLRRSAPRVIHVSAPGWSSSLDGVRVHHPRSVERVIRDGLPVTPLARTLVDFAASAPFHDVRRAVAEAEYRGLLDVAALEEVVGRGRPGAAALRAAFHAHQPRLAHTFSELEERFVALCEDHGLPLPQVNVMVAGFLVDAFWPHSNLIAELDGHAAHAGHVAIERDRHRELMLRGAGHLVVRYTWQQVTEQPEVVAADLSNVLGRPTITVSRRGGRVAEGTRLLSE